MSDIYLIRHGFTPANNANYNGQEGLFNIADNRNMPLDYKYGREQAQEVGEFLKNINGKNLIYVSPYRRAKETLKIALGISYMNCAVCKEELREIDSGVHYAKTKGEVLRMYPESVKFFEVKKNNPLNAKYLGGESEFDVRKRVENISKEIKKISEENEYDNIIIFGHGSVNRWISFWLTGDYIERPLKNGEIIRVRDNVAKSVFIPKLVVPIGYMVDIEKHKKI